MIGITDIFKGGLEYSDYSFETDNAIKEIKDVALKERFSLIFVIFPILSDGAQGESDWIVSKCQQYRIAYIDLREAFGKFGYEKIRISNDDYCHPNRTGNKLAAEEISQYLEKSFFKE